MSFNMNFPGMLGFNGVFPQLGNFSNNSGFPTNQFGMGNSIFNVQNMYMNNFMYTPSRYNMNFIKFPSFNFMSFNPNTFLSGLEGTSSTTVSSQTKTTLDSIVSMKYNDSSLTDKLNKLENAQEISSYILSNNKLTRTIETSDGGKIYIYEDKNGNTVGSINKDPNGKIRNIGLDIADGGSISINVGSDGKIENRFAMSKNNTENSHVGVKYDEILNTILKDYKGHTHRTENRDDGKTIDYYEKDGKTIASVLKDKDGKIISIDDFRGKTDGNNTSIVTYNDLNKDGKIDNGEGYIRYDKKL